MRGVKVPTFRYLAAPLGLLLIGSYFVLHSTVAVEPIRDLLIAAVLLVVGGVGSARRLVWRHRVSRALALRNERSMRVSGIEWGSSGPFAASRELWIFVEDDADKSLAIAIPLALGQRRQLPKSGAKVRVLGGDGIYVVVGGDGKAAWPISTAQQRRFPAFSVDGTLHAS